MKEELNIFIITSDNLKNRFNNLNTQIGKLKLLFRIISKSSMSIASG